MLRLVYRKAVICVAGLAVSAGLVCGAAVAGSPTGDAATIAFYRQVQIAYRSVPVIKGTRRGFFSYTVAGSSFRYYFGQKAPVGYRTATESLTYLLRNGRVTKFVDSAKARGLPPLIYIEDSTGAWATLASHPGACYFKESRIIGFWGQPWVGVFGDFSPLHRSGSKVIVNSTYSWGATGAQMSEVDSISATSKLLTSEEGHLSGPAAFSWSVTGLHEEAKPSLLLAPSPHC